MGILALAAGIWIATHSGLTAAGPRRWLVQRAGEAGFRGIFSAISLASIVFLIIAFRRAPAVPLWFVPPWLHGLLAIVMLAAFLLFVGSVSTRNPTAIGSETAAPMAPRGIQRITRHPMLCSFALWAAAHMAGLGTADGLLFFGAFLVVTLLGMPSIDAKLAVKNPALSAELARTTSILPFGAILSGRNRFVAGEIGWAWPLAALVLWALFVAFLHRWLFGVSPV